MKNPFKKKWKTVWEGPVIFDPAAGDGQYILQRHAEKVVWKAFFKNDNTDISISVSDLQKKYDEIKEFIRYDYWNIN